MESKNRFDYSYGEKGKGAGLIKFLTTEHSNFDCRDMQFIGQLFPSEGQTLENDQQPNDLRPRNEFTSPIDDSAAIVCFL